MSSNTSVNLTLSFSDYGTNSQMKNKFKAYMAKNDLVGFKMNKYPQRLSVMIVVIMEDLINNCIEFIEKGNNGIYLLRTIYIHSIIGKYDYLQKHIRQYNKNNSYEENLFFNIDKVYLNIETHIGEKLMLENETKNLINYLMMCVQYEILKLSKMVLLFSGKKTFNNTLFNHTISYFLTSNESLLKKILLKIDSYNFDKQAKGDNDKDSDKDSDNDEDTPENTTEKKEITTEKKRGRKPKKIPDEQSTDNEENTEKKTSKKSSNNDEQTQSSEKKKTKKTNNDDDEQSQTTEKKKTKKNKQ